MNQLEDDIRAVLRSQADAMQVPEQHRGSTTVALIDFERTLTQPEGRNRWPIVAVAAAAVAAVVVGGLVIATRTDAPKRVVPAAQPTTTVAQSAAVAQPPVEFTACVNVVANDFDATPEQIDLPDGETTIERYSGGPTELIVTDVSDPRLDGTWVATAVNDDYSGPGSDGLIIGTWTQRIETADGAWQGSHQTIDFPDGQGEGAIDGLYVMIGEGAYERLTAFMVLAEEGDLDCPNTRGYITPSA